MFYVESREKCFGQCTLYYNYSFYMRKAFMPTYVDHEMKVVENSNKTEQCWFTFEELKLLL